MAIQMYDAGIPFIIAVTDANTNSPVDLTTVQNIDLVFQKPNNAIISKLCDTLNAAGGVIRYISISTDFDVAGKWQFQVVIRFADSTTRRSSVGIIIVNSNIG